MPTSLPPRSAVENAVKDRYLQHFNEPVFRPAILNDPRYANCAGAGHLSTTLFLPDPAQAGVSRLMAIYTSRDGLTTERTFNGRYLTPAGVFRVLVALQTWPETVVEADRGLWEAAQTSINEDHAAFAASRGFSGPIVRFESTNVFLPGSSVGSPRNRASVIAALTNAGIAVTGYDLLMSIHIEPSVGEGGDCISGCLREAGLPGRRQFFLLSRPAHGGELSLDCQDRLPSRSRASLGLAGYT